MNRLFENLAKTNNTMRKLKSYKNMAPYAEQIIALDPIFMDNLLFVGERLKSTDLDLQCHSQIIIDK